VELKLINDKGAAGTTDVADAIFGREFNESLVHQIVVAYQANARRGTRKQKERSEIAKSTRKPWRQKGTGRARAGSNTSPLWPGGGVAFGPKPRNWGLAMNAKARKNALKGALTSRASTGDVIVMDPPALDAPKTKTLAALLEKVGLADRKVLWVFDKTGETVLKSSRNLARVETSESRALHTYALMNCDCLILSEAGLKRLTERLTA
jgi:large subunit ribosomal protein L4